MVLHVLEMSEHRSVYHKIACRITQHWHVLAFKPRVKVEFNVIFLI